MIYIVDTSAWIEYLIGSRKGLMLERLLDKQEHNKFITMECCISELHGYCLRNDTDFNPVFDVIRINSLILPVLETHWLEAANIRFNARKKIKDFGLIDAILVAKQKELKCTLVSCDSHFKGMKKVVFLGS